MPVFSFGTDAEMDAAEPFNQLMDRVKAGDATAAQSLWNLYHPAVLRLLRKRLPAHHRRAFDEDDVAASAFMSFFDGLAADRFPDLTEPDNLWNLLAVIAGRKAQSYVRFHGRKKRGGSALRGESAFAPTEERSVRGIEQVDGGDHSPATVVEFVDEVDNLLAALKDDDLRTIALLKLDGFSVAEIAAEAGMTQRAVQRRLALIRQTWRESAGVPN
ncbi:MAG: ECF-type sigma factor [Planctomycetaceae bacterium]